MEAHIAYVKAATDTIMAIIAQKSGVTSAAQVAAFYSTTYKAVAKAATEA